MRPTTLIAAASLLAVAACSDSPQRDLLGPDAPLFSHSEVGDPGRCISDQWTLKQVENRKEDRYDINGNGWICYKQYDTQKGNKSFTQTEYSDDIR